MPMPSAQPLSPAFSALFADYEGLWPVYLRAAAEEGRLLAIFERDTPRGKAAVAALRGKLGLDAAIAESDRLGDDLAGVARKILNAEPAGWPDLVALSRLIRQRNPPDLDGRTTGFYGEIPDFPRHIERLGTALAQAEAADAVLVELAARHEVMHVSDERRPDCKLNSEAELNALFDAIASWCPATLRGLAAMATTARLRNDDTLRETILEHVERLGGASMVPMPAGDAGTEAA